MILACFAHVLRVFAHVLRVFAHVLRVFCACFRILRKRVGRYLEKLNFQAVIKSAASAASRETKNQGPRSRGAPEPRRPQAEPSSVGSPGSWSLIFGLPGGCASSRLDHGLKV